MPGNSPWTPAKATVHVGGNLAANKGNISTTPFSPLGVVPTVKLRVYRVFGCSSGMSDDVVIAAMARTE